jgi:hypothetical protein
MKNERGEYKFVIQKPDLDYNPEWSHCAIFGPETPLPAGWGGAHVRVIYDRYRDRRELSGILRELADHIDADEVEFEVWRAQQALADPQFGTGSYSRGYEQDKRDVLARWKEIQDGRPGQVNRSKGADNDR